MKTRLGITVLALTAATTRAALYQYDFSGINATIPDFDPAGYSDTRTLSGLSGSAIGDVNVTLFISGGYNGDLYCYLVHAGGFTVLLNRTGRTAGDADGYANTGFAITLDDAAAADVHRYQSTGYSLNGGGQLTGAWQPDGRGTDPDFTVDTDARDRLLSGLNDLNPNGDWTLFLADVSPLGESTLTGWQLEINTVPEPVDWALLAFFLPAAVLHLARRRAWRRQSHLL